MATFNDTSREGVMRGLRELEVSAVNILLDRFVAARKQILGGQDGCTYAEAVEIVE